MVAWLRDHEADEKNASAAEHENRRGFIETTWPSMGSVYLATYSAAGRPDTVSSRMGVSSLMSGISPLASMNDRRDPRLNSKWATSEVFQRFARPAISH